ncbi:transcriptional regulator PpsR [Sulfitobacter sp. S190]|uniref:transcriptional regulator PpsR n=1 Tax=Sulfitobacter sp. S190 TaxID=2867022 RepID=UPI0021A6DE86|nr:transcriptional regulator PpsR [Sulfitobacter sp. S190]UWR24393.1 transcriptional regulator PpsR [Sulfitobacter sp. S190]
MKGEGTRGWTSALASLIGSDQAADIVARVTDLALLVDSNGIISNVMTHPGFKPAERVAAFDGEAMRDLLTVDSATRFDVRLSEFLQDPETPRTIEANHKPAGNYGELPVKYSFHRIGTGGTVLLLGRDMRAVADMQQQLVAAQIALEKDYEAQRENDTRFRVLMASIDEATLFVSLPDGVVRESNPAAQALFGKSGSDLSGGPLDHHFDGAERSGLIDRLVKAASDDGQGVVTLKARAAGRALAIRPRIFRVGAERLMLCRLSTTTGNALPSGTVQANLIGLYDHGADAIVFVAPGGDLLSGNEAFLSLSGVTDAKQLRGRSLADFLSRGSVDMNVILENAARSGYLRLYATKLVDEYGSERAVEISTTHLAAGDMPVFALVIRDITRSDAGRSDAPALGEVDSKSVVELIGSQSLRDIVAKTTDVVEKMCIETAVELTSNNRVAAAEMLGLSRQSLYVKLRKYGLLKSGGDT